jgi:hypothetical protein
MIDLPNKVEDYLHKQDLRTQPKKPGFFPKILGCAVSTYALKKPGFSGDLRKS